MNILVIKQTSLGDVLHCTPHLRAIRNKYPEAHLTVLTAAGSAQIIYNNPNVDEVVEFDYVGFKQHGLASPRGVWKIFKQTQTKLNQRHYDLAFDLQGLLRSVVFLYFTKANRKLVKGNWLGLNGFKNKNLHAIDEMSHVLMKANISVSDTSMQIDVSKVDSARLQSKLDANGLPDLITNGQTASFIIISPFTRWASKNWPLQRFIDLAVRLSKTHTVLLTGAPSDKAEVEAALTRRAKSNKNIVNLTGELSLNELAKLMSYAALVISGDSFPMHLATAVETPLITLFGPTDERKTGPRSALARVVRPGSCQRCDNPSCARRCLNQISVTNITSLVSEILGDNV